MTDSTAGGAYRFLFGGSTYCKMVTERSSMQMTAVYFCVRILSEAVAGLPLHLYKYNDSGGKEKALDHPLYFYPLMPNRMSVDRDEKGQLYYSYQTGKDETPTVKGSMVVLKPTDVLHNPGLGFEGLVGYSPIAMAKNAIHLAIATEEYGAKFFANGATPGGILEEGMKYTPISISLEQAQFWK